MPSPHNTPKKSRCDCHRPAATTATPVPSSSSSTALLQPSSSPPEARGPAECLPTSVPRGFVPS